jgi:co-chaperonin GroES (HSP10)
VQIINDYYMMTVSQRYESTISPAGIITLNTAWVHEEVIERFNYKRIYGRIEAIPLSYSQTIIEIKDPGCPTPRKHISGEHIQQQLNKGLKKYTRDHYCCAGLDQFDVLTVADVAKNTDIRRFDKVYFDPRVTENENILGLYKGQELFKIRVDDIICSVRDGEIIMQGGWCLVEPDMESWEEITTKAGIIMKPRPEAKTLRGIMRHFQHRDDLQAGDTILYARGADWTLKIEGKEYYAIQDQDILCKIL